MKRMSTAEITTIIALVVVIVILAIALGDANKLFGDPTPTAPPCPAPTGWQNHGPRVDLAIPNGNEYVSITIQLFMDEENGLISVNDEFEIFSPGKHTENILGNFIEYFLDCYGQIWLSPNTEQYLVATEHLP